MEKTPAANNAALHMKLPAALLAQAHRLAGRRGLSVASLVRMLLLRELEADSSPK